MLVYCGSVGQGLGSALEFDLFNKTGADYGGYHYDPLFHAGEQRRDGEMLVSDDEAGDTAAAAAAAAAAAPAAAAAAAAASVAPKVRRVLHRHNAVHEHALGVDHVLAALRRLSLVARDDAMDLVISDTDLDSPRSISDGVRVESTSMASSFLADEPSVVAPRLFDGSMDLATSGIDLCSSRPVQSDPVLGSSAMASSVGGAEPGVVASELFNGSSIDEERCRARMYSDKKLPVPFSQCDKQAKFGRFCGRHKNGQAQGLWDPPLHASLPAKKFEEAKVAVVTWRLRNLSAPLNVQGDTGADGVAVGVVGKAMGKGRGGKRDVWASDAPVDAAVDLMEPAVGDTKSRSSDFAAALSGAIAGNVGVGNPTSVTRGSVLRRTRGLSGSAGVGDVRADLVGVGDRDAVAGSSLLRRPRGSTRLVGADRGNMTEIRTENDHVNEEMRRRGFRLHGGQWTGGQFLPGEPADMNLGESFLRAQFQQRRMD